ncbi:MAG: nitrilase family protein [Muribaculaceae bacterium]|nr:nitrilase family protein [Muribaculaceae bacterium]
MTELKIALLPIDTTWADVEENLYVAEQILKTLPSDTDIVVVPELFSTGFIADAAGVSRFAESGEQSEVMKRIRLMSAHFNVAIAGTILARNTENNPVNRGFLIEPSGETTIYDKKHLFSVSPEAATLDAGKHEIPVVRFRGWNIALAICYDLRFPAWLRNTGAKYDLLILPANWPVKRQLAWDILLKARAIENIAYVAGVNRSGSDDYGVYDDKMSQVIDYAGNVISSTRTDGVVLARLDKSRLNSFRDKFPFLKDADSFNFC